MDIGNIANQNTAISAYTAQQQTAASHHTPGDQTQGTGNAPVSNTPQKAKTDQVNFTKEALQLSAQANQQSQATNTVNQANEAQNGNATNGNTTQGNTQQGNAPQGNPPQNSSQIPAYLASGAQSVTQAINTYHNTFKF